MQEEELDSLEQIEQQLREENGEDDGDDAIGVRSPLGGGPSGRNDGSEALLDEREADTERLR